MPPFKSGFVSIIGRPNVGKSTLLNAILGEKIAIVSPKPQTTRNRIRGIKNMEDAQIIFLDTPGIHSDKGYLNEFMIKEAISAIEDVDVIIYLVEASKTLEKDDSLIIDNLRRIKSPVILGINKTDITRKDNILPLINEYSKLYSFKEIIPISATRGEGIETLVKIVVELLPEGPKYFPEDILTDLPERFIVAEIVREKIFKLTRQEIPYSTAVVIDSFKENPKLVPAEPAPAVVSRGNKQGKGLVSISATINVERDSQKGIIIGKGGKMLKEIGTLSRIDIEKLLGAKVYLELFVKVEKDWTKDKKLLKEFGYH
ncbi:MAG TPA: GTPase Era [Thermodesulfobacteriota bacterium]|nr:GTPase Era [Thermodesulfobacteriota bacterium]